LTGTPSFVVCTLWIDECDQSELISNLHYISIAIGFTASGQIGGRIMDRIYRSLSKEAGGKGLPEFRIPYMLPGMIIMPMGLFWYGWSAERKLHWVMVNFGVVIFTLGSYVIAQATSAY
jgi:hypothetical protein